MPARKRRLGKFGTENQKPKPSKPEQVSAEIELIGKLQKQEAVHPNEHHYVGWPDMAAAERLRKKGYIIDDGGATGCFRLTQSFRNTFKEFRG